MNIFFECLFKGSRSQCFTRDIFCLNSLRMFLQLFSVYFCLHWYQNKMFFSFKQNYFSHIFVFFHNRQTLILINWLIIINHFIREFIHSFIDRLNTIWNSIILMFIINRQRGLIGFAFRPDKTYRAVLFSAYSSVRILNFFCFSSDMYSKQRFLCIKKWKNE